MNITQKIYAIVKKDTGEIVNFSVTEQPVLREWLSYYSGTIDETGFELKQTFMSQNEIKAQMGIS